MIFSQRKYIVQGILFIFLALVILIPEGSLLCLGEKGHRMIEFIESCKNSVAHLPLHRSPEHHVANDDCGTCFDIPSPENIIMKDSRQQSLQQPLLAGLVTTPLILLEICDEHFQTFTFIRHAFSLKSLQSAVLRI